MAAKPVPALFVFVLMGVGVLSALLAMAVGKQATVSISVPILAALLLGIVLILLLPDVGEGPEADVTFVLAFASIAVVTALFVLLLGVKVAVPVALVLLATATVGMGLYGGVKLAVHARMTDDGAAVSAELGAGAQPLLKLHVRAVLPPQARTLDLRVLVRKPDSEATLLRAQLVGDRGGELDETVEMPVPLHKEWTEIVVRRCLDDTCDDHNSRDLLHFSELSPPPARIEQG